MSVSLLEVGEGVGCRVLFIGIKFDRPETRGDDMFPITFLLPSSRGIAAKEKVQNVLPLKKTTGSEISTHHHVSIIIMCIRQKANIRVCSPSKNEWPVRPVRDSNSMTDNCRISTEFFCTRKFGVFQQTEEGTLSCASRSEI